MVEYSKDVADRVLRILQASGQVEPDAVKEAMAQSEARSARALAYLMKDKVDEDLVITILSRAYALRR